jgi:hypothetical protein
MKKSFPIILLLLVAVSAPARGVFSWSEAKMQTASDLIVVGTITKVQDLDETNSVLWPGSKFRGVEATFAVSKVLKGDAATRTVVLHYYRFETEWGRPANGPCFLNLTPTDTNQFLLYLVRDGASRFAPVSGQVDPLLDAVRVFPPHSALPSEIVGDWRSQDGRAFIELRADGLCFMGAEIGGAGITTYDAKNHLLTISLRDDHSGNANQVTLIYDPDAQTLKPREEGFRLATYTRQSKELPEPFKKAIDFSKVPNSFK